jgi:hypothetical protein
MLKSYFFHFHDRHEIVHLPGLLDQSKGENVMDGKKNILILAMCCAGAVAHPNQELRQYATGLQELLWRSLNYESIGQKHGISLCLFEGAAEKSVRLGFLDILAAV